MPDVTIYTLAKKLNMSPSMVSRAFNPEGRIDEEKRKIVLRAAAEYNFSPNKFASRLPLKPVNIGVLINSNFEINTEKMIAGLKAAYSRMKDYKIKYDITVLDDSVDGMDAFSEVMERYKKLDGVCVTGMGASVYTELLDSIYAENPNVVQVQGTNREAKCLLESRHNEKTASYLAAEFLNNSLMRSVRKNIMLFTGKKESPLHSEAKEAFYAAAYEYGMNIIECIDMRDDEECLADLLPTVFERSGENADGIYITSGASIALCRYLEENKLSLPFVAFDTYDEIKKYMKKGIVSAAISQNVPKQMETAFEKLVHHIIAGEECERTVYTDVQIVLKSNMHQFE